MHPSENNSRVFEDESIDIIGLLRELYLSRWLIVKTTTTAAFLAMLWSLTLTNIYTSEVTLIPQTNGGNGTSSSLSGLASIAGLNLDRTSSFSISNIPPSLYPQIISSIPFKKQLLKEQIWHGDNRIPISEYLLSNSDIVHSISNTLKKYTIGLPGTIMSKFDCPADEMLNGGSAKIIHIRKEELGLFGYLDSNLSLTLNEVEGFITLGFSDKDKYVAAQIVELAKERLQFFVIEFKNQWAREQLKLAARQYNENKIVYERLQDSLAIFKDKNLNISSSLYQNRLDRLESDVAIASSVAEQLASELEKAKLQVNKDTPIFTIIEPVTVPYERSSPKRSLIVAVFAFVGLTLSTIYALVHKQFTTLFQSITRKNYL
jgi:hypothetical protein